MRYPDYFDGDFYDDDFYFDLSDGDLAATYARYDIPWDVKRRKTIPPKLSRSNTMVEPLAVGQLPLGIWMEIFSQSHPIFLAKTVSKVRKSFKVIIDNNERI